MKCVRCGKNSATVKLTRIVKGKVMEMSLCQSCAAEVSPYQKKLAAAEGLNALIAHLIKAEQGGKAEETSEATPPQEEVVDLTCPACTTTFQTYKRTFMLGCEHCYEAFGDPLLTDIRKIHGSVQHNGRRPDRVVEPPPLPQSLDQLRLQLQKAIDDEDYEKAAYLRDQVRILQEEQDTP